MSLPEEVLTVSKRGKVEARRLVSRGEFAIVEYVDPNTMERTEDKVKLILRHGDGRVDEYFLIPIKGGGRRLMIEPKVKKGDRIMVLNPETGEAEPAIP